MELIEQILIGIVRVVCKMAHNVSVTTLYLLLFRFYSTVGVSMSLYDRALFYNVLGKYFVHLRIALLNLVVNI